MSWGEEEQTVMGHMSSPDRRREEEGFRMSEVLCQACLGPSFQAGPAQLCHAVLLGMHPKQGCTPNGDARLLRRVASEQGTLQGFPGRISQPTGKNNGFGVRNLVCCWSKTGGWCQHTLGTGQEERGRKASSPRAPQRPRPLQRRELW